MTLARWTVSVYILEHKRPCAVRDASIMPLSQYFNVREPEPIRSEAAGEQPALPFPVAGRPPASAGSEQNEAHGSAGPLSRGLRTDD